MQCYFVSIPNREFDTLYLRRDAFHGEWNYALIPRPELPAPP